MAAKEETGSLSDAEKEHFAKVEALVKKFEDAMEDDFNTADAVSAIFEIVRESNSTVKDFSADYAKKVLKVLEDLCGVLGIETTKEEEILDEEIEKLIEERQAARKNKDFARADEIRDQLLEQGIVLKDTREGVKWSRA
jgi:cysteinyl-tRNA synthetase